MFNIEKNIPLEEKTKHKNESLKGMTAFLRTLEIGDSILIEKSIRGGIYQTARQAGVKIKAKRENEKVRIWRTE